MSSRAGDGTRREDNGLRVDFVEVVLIPLRSPGVSCLTAKESEENAIRERERNVVRDVRFERSGPVCLTGEASSLWAKKCSLLSEKGEEEVHVRNCLLRRAAAAVRPPGRQSCQSQTGSAGMRAGIRGKGAGVTQTDMRQTCFN